MGYGEGVCGFGQVMETLSSGAGEIGVLLLAQGLSHVSAESPAAPDPVAVGKREVWALWLPPPLRNNTGAEKQRVVLASL